MNSNVRRVAFGAAVVFLTTISCGTTPVDAEKKEAPPAAAPTPVMASTPSLAPESRAVAVDPSAEVVATVLGRSIRRSELDAATLEQLICPPLFEKYRQDRGIAATESEVAECVAFFQKHSEFDKILAETFDPEDEAELSRHMADPDSWRLIAEDTVLQWKESKRLYEEFGGEVIFQQANPLEPVGAYRAFLQAQEKAHAFEILDTSLAPEFWEYYTRKQMFVVDAEDVDYSKPWWRQP